MQIFDAHVHIWTHQPEYPWSAEEQEFPVETAHPEDLIAILKSSGVARAVLVQFIKYRWDNRYVAHILRAHPAIFTGVCRVDPQDPCNADQLSFWTEEAGFRGVRLSPEADARGDWFTGPLMVPLFKRAAALRVPVILLITPERLQEIVRIVEQVPDVTVIIDHLADCINQPDARLQKLLRLVRYPGVFLKLGHIAQHSSEGFPWRDTHTSLEKIFQTFSAQRILWGSDWPFSLNECTYAQSLDYVLESIKFLTPQEREWVVGGTARQIWPERPGPESVLYQEKI